MPASALAGASVVIDDLRGFDAALATLVTPDASRLRPRMDLAITIGQGLGFGVACGLSTIALLVPLFWPGIDARALGALGAPGLVLAAVDVWLPQSVRIAAARRRGCRGLRVLDARRPRLGGHPDRRRRRGA